MPATPVKRDFQMTGESVMFVWLQMPRIQMLRQTIDLDADRDTTGVGAFMGMSTATDAPRVELVVACGSPQVGTASTESIQNVSDMLPCFLPLDAVHALSAIGKSCCYDCHGMNYRCKRAACCCCGKQQACDDQLVIVYGMSLYTVFAGFGLLLIVCLVLIVI